MDIFKSDFELITHKFPEEFSRLNVYGIGDTHFGSREHNEEAWDRWKKTVLADPNGVVVLVGDMMDMGLKNSKTSVYEQTMTPFEQKHFLVNELRPLVRKDKIIGGVPGNHEHRATDLFDGCPLYDVMCKLDIEDVYRHNMAFIKVSLGHKNSTRQYAYSIMLAHGASKLKTERFGYAVDGIDAYFTGHLHEGADRFPAKIVVDMKNETVSEKPFKHIRVASFTRTGGYGLRGMYTPHDSSIFPILTFYGDKKGVEVRWI